MKLIILINTIFCLACFSSEAMDAKPMIVGGTRVEDPSLLFSTVGIFNDKGPFCTGTYIGRERVLTAAHCVESVQSSFYDFPFVKFVNPPLKNMNHKTDCLITSYIAHPDYRIDQKNSWSADIGILKIKCSSKFPLETLQTPLLPKEDLTIDWSKVSILGYGLSSTRMECSGSCYPVSEMTFPTLNQVSLLKIDQVDDELDKASPFIAKGIKEGKLICYKASDNSTFFLGDSGGPSLLQTSSKQSIILGVHSFVSRQKDNVVLVCDVAVRAYLPWIEAQLN